MKLLGLHPSQQQKHRTGAVPRGGGLFLRARSLIPSLELTLPSPVVGIHASDRAVLVSLFESRGNGRVNSPQRWLTAADTEKWRGVVVKEGRVVMVHLVRQSLSGELFVRPRRCIESDHVIVTGFILHLFGPKIASQVATLLGFNFLSTGCLF